MKKLKSEQVVRIRGQINEEILDNFTAVFLEKAEIICFPNEVDRTQSDRRMFQKRLKKNGTETNYLEKIRLESR